MGSMWAHWTWLKVAGREITILSITTYSINRNFQMLHLNHEICFYGEFHSPRCSKILIHSNARTCVCIMCEKVYLCVQARCVYSVLLWMMVNALHLCTFYTTRLNSNVRAAERNTKTIDDWSGRRQETTDIKRHFQVSAWLHRVTGKHCKPPADNCTRHRRRSRDATISSSNERPGHTRTLNWPRHKSDAFTLQERPKDANDNGTATRRTG